MKLSIDTLRLCLTCELPCLCSSDSGLIKDELGALMCERDALKARCKQLEAGLYGLPEAVADIQAFKTKLAAMSENRAGKQ